MERYQKILLGLFTTIVIIVGGIQIYFSFFLDQQLKETAVKQFHETTDDSYELKINDFDLRILGRQLSLSDIKLAKKEQARGTDIKLTLDAFNVSGIGLIKLLFRQELTLKEIELINPEVYITAAESKASEEKIRWNRPAQQLSKMALNVLDHISIPEFNITGLSINFNRADLPVDPYFSITNSDITLYNITIDSTSLNDDRIIPADDMATTFRDIKIQTPNELYEITSGSLEFSTSNSRMILSDLSLVPKFDKEQFSEKVGHQIDRITLDIEDITWDGIHIEELNKAGGITTEQVNITNADLDIFRDKRHPEAPETNRPLPQEMIRAIPFSIMIDSIRFTNSNIRYTERKPKAEKEGYIEFANLSADFTNLTNIEAQWNDGKTPALRAETDVWGQARLDAQFSFPMADGKNRQEIKGSLQPMDMQLLNVALEPLAFVRIDEGRILGLEFDMNLSETHGGGELTLEYENLKISLLDEEGTEETLGDKAKSILANTFKIKSKNKGDDPRISKIDFDRIEDKSVFNYWWKSLLSGLKESIGL